VLFFGRSPQNNTRSFRFIELMRFSVAAKGHGFAVPFGD
jgi:hypothetical protein